MKGKAIYSGVTCGVTRRRQGVPRHRLPPFATCSGGVSGRISDLVQGVLAMLAA
jgi:hypothetical protein